MWRVEERDERLFQAERALLETILTLAVVEVADQGSVAMNLHSLITPFLSHLSFN